MRTMDPEITYIPDKSGQAHKQIVVYGDVQTSVKVWWDDLMKVWKVSSPSHEKQSLTNIDEVRALAGQWAREIRP